MNEWIMELRLSWVPPQWGLQPFLLSPAPVSCSLILETTDLPRPTKGSISLVTLPTSTSPEPTHHLYPPWAFFPWAHIHFLVQRVWLLLPGPAAHTRVSPDLGAHLNDQPHTGSLAPETWKTSQPSSLSQGLYQFWAVDLVSLIPFFPGSFEFCKFSLMTQLAWRIPWGFNNNLIILFKKKNVSLTCRDT